MSRIRDWRVLFAMTAATCAIGACSALTSFDSLVGNSGDASNAIDGSNAADAPNDSKLDAASALDANAPFSCANIDADLCDDFSRDAALGPGSPWTSVLCDEGSMTIENGILHIAYPATNGSDQARCQLTKCFSNDCNTSGTVYSGITIDLDFRYQTTATSGVLTIAQPNFIPTGAPTSDAGGHGYVNQVVATNAILGIDVGDNVTSNAAITQTQVYLPDASVNPFPATNAGHTESNAFVSGAPSHLHLEVNVATQTSVLTLEIGGTIYTATPPVPLIVNGASPGVVELPLGYIQDIDQTLPAFDYYIDNVVVRLEP